MGLINPALVAILPVYRKSYENGNARLWITLNENDYENKE